MSSIYDTSPFTFIDPSGDLQRFLRAYRPRCLSQERWATVADDCIELVKVAGSSKRERLEQDIQCLAAIGAALVERGRPLTLHEMLTDTALAHLDHALLDKNAAGHTRENRLSDARRMQAIHLGLPWQLGRNKENPRRGRLAKPAVLDQVNGLQAAAANAGEAGLPFLKAVDAAWDGRCGGDGLASLPAEDWVAARRFAEERGVNVTQAALRAAATHRVLGRPEPVVVLMSRFGLTRRDLDLGLTVAAELPHRPDEAAAGALRGSSQN